MEIAIDNRQTIIPLKSDWEALINVIVETALKLEGVTPSEGFEVSISFVDDTEIRELNREYRQKDYATDVLSFPVDDINDYDDGQNDFLLGDIVVSLETAARQANEYGHSFERELGFLLTHGMIHLLGYDHVDNEEDAAKMRKKEEAVLEVVGLHR